MYFSWKSEEWDVSVVATLYAVALLVYLYDHPNLLLVRCPSRLPDHVTHTCKPKNLSVHGFAHFIAACHLHRFQWFDNYRKRTWAAFMVYSFPKCTFRVFNGMTVAVFNRSFEYCSNCRTRLPLSWARLQFGLWSIQQYAILSREGAGFVCQKAFLDSTNFNKGCIRNFPNLALYHFQREDFRAST